jgi:hypothetical protein
MVCARTGGVPGRAPQPRPGFFLRRFHKWIGLGLYGFPFSIGRNSSPIGRFRALSRHYRFARQTRLLRAVAAVAMTLAWPLGAFSTALGTLAHIRRGEAQNRFYVFLDMYWLALRHNIPPIEYALYRFDKPERRKNLQDYIYSNDLPGLAALNTRLGAVNRDVQDKARFAEICARNGFAHVATLAVFDRGEQIFPESAFVPDGSTLWVKSLRLKGGAGGAKWVKDGDAYRNVMGDKLVATKLVEEIRKQDCLVQPFIENHPDIGGVTNGALASLRIVTGIDARGQAKLVAALLALPHGIRETSVAGILCSIDCKSGRIRRAALPDGEAITNHPDTEALIVGIDLPYWRESVDLVLRAHASAFSRFAFLGWDIALTREKPLLLEANSGWGALFHQMLDGPLGHTDFVRLLSCYV